MIPFQDPLNVCGSIRGGIRTDVHRHGLNFIKLFTHTKKSCLLQQENVRKQNISSRACMFTMDLHRYVTRVLTAGYASVSYGILLYEIEIMLYGRSVSTKRLLTCFMKLGPVSMLIYLVTCGSFSANFETTNCTATLLIMSSENYVKLKCRHRCLGLDTHSRFQPL